MKPRSGAQAAQILAGALKIGARAPEALRTEIIGYPAAGDRLQARAQERSKLGGRQLRRSQADREAIAGERTARQLARVRVRLEHLVVRTACAEPVDRGARSRQREPLGGHRAAVLEARVADLLGTAAGEARQLARHPLRVGVDLAHLHQHVRAAAGRCEPELLLDQEVLRVRTQLRLRECAAVRARRRERRRARTAAHSRRRAACAPGGLPGRGGARVRAGRHGAHVLVKVRKVNANTQWVARELARFAGCRPEEVGYAGLKDRRAVATQWLSLPRPRAAVDWLSARGADYEVLEAHPHTRKLPRGALAGNRFAIRLRPAQLPAAELAALCARACSR